MKECTCDCDCTPKNLTMIPVRGLSFAVDPDDLPSCPPVSGCTCREKLTEALDLYVSPEGSDDNNGLSPATALANIMSAVDRTANYAPSTHLITINVAAGSYTEDVQVDFRWHYPNLAIKGDPATMPLLVGGLSVRWQGFLSVENLHVKSSYINFDTQYYAHMTLTNCRATTFGGANYAVTYTALFSTLWVAGNLNIDCASGVGVALRVNRFAQLAVNSDTRIQVNGKVTTSTVSAHGQGQATISADSLSGTVSGRRYICSSGGLIAGTGGVATIIPGSIDGTVSAGGVYA